MKRLLIVCPDFPYPDNYGGRKDIWNRIKLFFELGYYMDIICTVKENPRKEDIIVVKKYVQNVFILKRNRSLSYLFTRMPFQLKSRDKLAKFRLSREYDYIILEGDYVLPFLLNDDISDFNKIIFRMHNDEHTYFKQLCESEKHIFKKFYYYLESKRFKYIKEKYISNLKHIWFISKDEMDNFKSKNNNFKPLFLPPHVPENSYKLSSRVKKNRNVLFVGSLFMVNNKEAILWYLKNIHDLLSKIPGYCLTIVGNSKGTSLDWLYNSISLCESKDNIIVYDTPRDLSAIYNENSIFVNPMFHGAGVKLKTIEAIQNGLAVVSTKVGIEGTGLIDGKHVLVSDTPRSFLENIQRLMDDETLREQLIVNAQNYLRKEFNTINKIKEYLSEV
jgi:polysaccharide biosynthesis protein PslH